MKKLEEQAQSAIEGKHYNTAVSLLDRALALAPGNDRAKMMQADACTSRSYHESVYQPIRYHLSMSCPPSPSAIMHEVHILILFCNSLIIDIRLKNLGQADRIVSAILRANSSNTEALYLRGVCMYEKGELDRAIDHFKRALRGNPDHSKSRIQLKRTKKLADVKQQGNDAYKSGNWDEALALYDQVRFACTTCCTFVCLVPSPQFKALNSATAKISSVL